MTILLAGAQGFLGRHVKAALEQAGHTVLQWSLRAFDDRGRPRQNPSLTESDLYINCAGNTETPEFMYESNVAFAKEMLESARILNKRLIHIGSIAEDLPGNSVYQATKRAATNLCLAYAEEWNVDVCVVKPSTIYGVGDKDSAFLPTLWRAYKQGTAFRPTNEFRGWVHVKDVAAAIALLVDPVTPRGVYEVNSDYVHNLALFDLFKAVVGSNVRLDESTGRDEGAGWPRHGCTWIREAGWKPQYDLEKGIREFVEYMQMQDTSEQAWTGAEL